MKKMMSLAVKTLGALLLIFPIVSAQTCSFGIWGETKLPKRYLD